MTASGTRRSFFKLFSVLLLASLLLSSVTANGTGIVRAQEASTETPPAEPTGSPTEEPPTPTATEPAVIPEVPTDTPTTDLGVTATELATETETATATAPALLRREALNDQEIGVTEGIPAEPGFLGVALRDLPQTQPSNVEQPVRPLFMPPESGGGSLTPNGLGSSPQSELPALNMPATGTQFAGMANGDGGSGWPPDPVGDVGPNNYVQAVNSTVRVFSKAGATQLTVSLETLMSGSSEPHCNTGGVNRGQPMVIYDHDDDRWFIADVAYASFQDGPYTFCIAASQSGDPTGFWTNYAIDVPIITPLPTNSYLPALPIMGLWREGLYVSANMYDCTDASCSAATFEGTQAWALNLSDMVFQHQLHWLVTDLLPVQYDSLIPSNYRGTLPPVDTPDYLAAVYIDGSNYFVDVWKFAVDWGDAFNDPSFSFTGPTQVAVGSYAVVPSAIPENGGVALDSLGDQLMMQNQYRYRGGSESLWLAQTVGSGGVTGIRWYQLNVTGGTIAGSPVQAGTFQPDSTYRWMPSLAVDRQGNMAVGYGASSSSLHPEIRYAGRLVTDPLNALSQGESTMIAGAGSQTTTGRWGDHSSMTVDPVDDCTFWYTNEYYAATGTNWQTRIGSFKFPSCSYVDVSVAASLMGSYDLASNQTLSESYPSLLDGPVKVKDQNGQNIFTSQLVISGPGNSFNETMGYPSNQFTTDYWFPYYDHGYPSVGGDNVRTWILVGNPSTSSTATVNIYIGGVLQTGSPFSIPAGSRVTPRWIGTIGGPVHVSSNIPVFASERVFTVPDDSFSEMMGYPANQFTTEYWFPWYDSINMASTIKVGNASSSQTANVDIYIGAVKKGSYTIPHDQTMSQSYASVLDGPVRVVATNGINIVASQWTLSGSSNSFNEIMGHPFNQFTTGYLFPWYDHGYPSVGGDNVRTWVLVGNPSASSTASVSIYIGGALMSGSPFSIPAGSRVTPRWIGTIGGPVHVVSTIPVFASERVFTVPQNSFNEMMGYPVNKLTSEYWFPWYDSVNMQNSLYLSRP